MSSELKPGYLKLRYVVSFKKKYCLKQKEKPQSLIQSTFSPSTIFNLNKTKKNPKKMALPGESVNVLAFWFSALLLLTMLLLLLERLLLDRVSGLITLPVSLLLNVGSE
jgi:hypothetical protein